MSALMSPAVATPALQLRGVGKRYTGVQVVSDVDLHVEPGEVVALIGENGAGKSTLMKIVSGVLATDDCEGELLPDGRPTRFRTVREAEAAGIVLVAQELHIAPNLSIAENMFMGMLPGRFGLVDERKLRALAAEQLRFFGIKVPRMRMAAGTGGRGATSRPRRSPGDGAGSRATTAGRPRPGSRRPSAAP